MGGLLRPEHACKSKGSRRRDELEDFRVFQNGQMTSTLLDASLPPGAGVLGALLDASCPLHRWINGGRGPRDLDQVQLQLLLQHMQ
jgi:hypothetical protein